MDNFGLRFNAIVTDIRKRLKAAPSKGSGEFFNLSSSALTQIKKGEKYPSFKMLNRLITLHPEYNLNWLFTGGESMLLSESGTANEKVVALQNETSLLKRTLNSQLTSTERAHEEADIWRERLEECKKRLSKN